MSEAKRGRPPLVEGDTPARIHVSVPSKDYDRAQAAAERRGVSVPELVRRSLTRTLSEEPDDDE